MRATGVAARSRHLPIWLGAIYAAAFIFYIGGFVALLVTSSSGLLGALLIAPVLVLLTYPVARLAGRVSGDEAMVGIVMGGAIAKLMASMVRYWIANVVYDGAADSNQYHEWGKALAPMYRRLDFSMDVGSIPGTGFLRALTGAIYSVVGTSKLGGFLIFAWLAFLGLLLLWRAFSIAVPTGDARRYAILLLFLPSLLYWPSSVGKEAWIILGIGVVSYGLAAAMTGRYYGVAILALGLVSVMIVRPHVALLVFVGVAFAAVLYRSRRRTPLGPIVKLAALAAVVVIGLLLVGQTQTFLGVENLNRETIDEKLADAEGRTSEGGSAFSPVRVNTPLDLPWATTTVLFRPFPGEVGSVQAVVASLEGGVLLGLVITSWSRLRSLPRLLRTTPYVAYSLGFLLTFIYAFSAFANFGILARQRTQVLPFLLVLLALPVLPKRRRRRGVRAPVAFDEEPDVEPAVKPDGSVPITTQ